MQNPSGTPCWFLPLWCNECLKDLNVTATDNATLNDVSLAPFHSRYLDVSMIYSYQVRNSEMVYIMHSVEHSAYVPFINKKKNAY